jgi:DNA-binding response OmpR family regulator
MITVDFNALLIEPDDDRAALLSERLNEAIPQSVNCERVTTVSDGESRLAGEDWDLLIVRLRMPGARGLDPLVRARLKNKGVPMIAICEEDEAEVVLDAAKSMADVCLEWKDVPVGSLAESVELARSRRSDFESEVMKEVPLEEEIASFKEALDCLGVAALVVSARDGSLLYENAIAREWFGDDLGEAIAAMLEYELLGSQGVEAELSLECLPSKHLGMRSERMLWMGEDARLIALKDISKQKRIEDAYMAYRLKREADEAPQDSFEAQEANSELVLSRSRDFPSGKALIVDDEEVLRMVLQSILTTLGFETIAASDGEEALQLYDEIGDSISLAIIDMNMPGLNGGEVFKRVRRGDDSIPILVTSGLDEFDSEPFGGFDDCSGFLMKPFGAAEVRVAIEELLGETLASTPGA